MSDIDSIRWELHRERIAHIATMGQAAESLRRERMLAEALRDAIDVAHETDSLRNHSDDERKDGWFRAPLYRCTDVTCEQANEALRQHDDAINRSADDTVDDTKSQGGSDREPDGTSHDPAASGTDVQHTQTDRPDAPMRDAVVAAAITAALEADR